jgi:hypothetical protein
MGKGGCSRGHQHTDLYRAAFGPPLFFAAAFPSGFAPTWVSASLGVSVAAQQDHVAVSHQLMRSNYSPPIGVREEWGR